MPHRFIFLILLLGVGVLQQRGIAQCPNSTVAGYSPALEPKAEAFFASLLAAVRAADTDKVASMVQYPLAVNTVKGRLIVRSGSEFVRIYDQIFTPALKQAIEEQLPECLFANWQGVMIGHGEVWFAEQPDGAIKITAINPPGRKAKLLA